MPRAARAHASVRKRSLPLGSLFCYNNRMNTQLKMTKIGNSAGVVLPKELLARLRVGPGDMIYATESPDGVRLDGGQSRFRSEDGAGGADHA